MKLDLDLRKIGLGVGLGLTLAAIFALNINNVLDFIFIRWEYLFAPVIGVFYLSIQPYLNYATARRYFVTGAKFGLVLAGVVILMNLAYEFGFYNELSIVEDPLRTTISYLLFALSYSLVGGIGHYIFNRNVDSRKKDIFRSNYYGLGLLIGAFSFLLIAITSEIVDANNINNYFEAFVPVAVGAYVTIQLHHVGDKQIARATMLGALTGLFIALLQGFLSFLVIFVRILATSDISLLILNQPAESVIQLLVILPILIVTYSIVGGGLGFGMKFIHDIT
jgi:hypothetical protein